MDLKEMIEQLTNIYEEYGNVRVWAGTPIWYTNRFLNGDIRIVLDKPIKFRNKIVPANVKLECGIKQ